MECITYEREEIVFTLNRINIFLLSEISSVKVVDGVRKHVSQKFTKIKTLCMNIADFTSEI